MSERGKLERSKFFATCNHCVIDSQLTRLVSSLRSERVSEKMNGVGLMNQERPLERE